MASKTDQANIDTGQQTTTEHRSQLQQFWRQYKQNYLSLVGGAIILGMILVAIFAPFLAPHDPVQQFNTGGDEFHPLPPGSEITVEGDDGTVQSRTVAILGTDHVGRDILSRLIFGVRRTLIIAFSVVAFAMITGSAAGALAGYYSDTWIDNTIMRTMDMIFPFPSLILAIALLGVVGVGTTTYELPVGTLVIPNMAKMILVISIVYVPRFARVMQGAVLKEMEEDYIDAQRVLGASDMRILGRDVTINTIPAVVIQATLYMGTAVLISAGLSFLGLGIQPPKSSLGVMLASSRDYVYSGEWWFSIFPGIAIMLVIIGFNFLGDGLRDALDPRHQGRET